MWLMSLLRSTGKQKQEYSLSITYKQKKSFFLVHGDIIHIICVSTLSLSLSLLLGDNITVVAIRYRLRKQPYYLAI